MIKSYIVDIQKHFWEIMIGIMHVYTLWMSSTYFFFEQDNVLISLSSQFENLLCQQVNFTCHCGNKPEINICLVKKLVVFVFIEVSLNMFFLLKFKESIWECVNILELKLNHAVKSTLHT